MSQKTFYNRGVQSLLYTFDITLAQVLSDANRLMRDELP